MSDDGRMVSHSRYESKVFGSGWFNADGRVVVVPPSASDSDGDGRDVVQVSAHIVLPVGDLRIPCITKQIETDAQQSYDMQPQIEGHSWPLSVQH